MKRDPMDSYTILDGAPPRPKVQAVQKTCYKCSRSLTFKDRKTCFRMDEGFNSDLLQFQNINQASRVTGLSLHFEECLQEMKR